MKNDVLRDASRVALIRTDVSEKLSTSIIRDTRIGELGTTLAVQICAVTYVQTVLFFLFAPVIL
jgi:hypothetical protein